MLTTFSKPPHLPRCRFLPGHASTLPEVILTARNIKPAKMESSKDKSVNVELLQSFTGHTEEGFIDNIKNRTPVSTQKTFHPS